MQYAVWLIAITSVRFGVCLVDDAAERQRVQGPLSFLATRETDQHFHGGTAPAAAPEGESSAEDPDDAEETDESAPEAPPGVAATLAPAAATKSSVGTKDEETEDVGPQVPVVAVVTIKNMDYQSLAEDQSLHGAVEAAVRDAVADAAGDDIESDEVAIVSWPGSVRARAVIKPQSDVTSDTIVDELQNSKLSTVITNAVNKLKGIERTTKAAIAVDVDVMVATKQSSVSKVMAKAKGQKHLSRVYELEKEAAAARQRISDIVLEGEKLDLRIKDLENEEAFQKKVDERVKQVKKELEAPVFAETIGDLWKEMRMFGSPCLLKYLREEKAAIKTRVLEGEQNATNIEEQLHQARDDVHEAWYPPPPPPKSGCLKMSFGLASSFVAAAMALL